MSASISLLRSRRKVVENCDDSGEESDCSIKDVNKKESIEKDARTIAAINMLTVSMVNQLLEQQGLDPFGKSLGSPSHENDQTWSTPTRPTGRPSITRSVKENTIGKKSRKSVRFTPECNKADFTPEMSTNSDRLDLTHTRTASVSSLKMEPKFTPIRRSKVLKAGMLRSLENEQDIGSVDNFVCSSDSLDSPLPTRNMTAQIETMDDTPSTPVVEMKSSDTTPQPSHHQPVVTTPACVKAVPDESSSPAASSEMTPCEGNENTNISNLNESVSANESDKNDLPCETPVRPKWTHHFDPTSPEHMSPFLKTLLEERAERSQGKELSKSFSLLEDCEDQPRLTVLKGVVAFVEVRRADEDRSSGFRWKLKQLGAQVEENFTKKVTHVVFQEGLLSTYRKAKESSVHLVSAFWVMACDESSSRVPEDKYPIDEEDKYSMLAPLKKYIRRPKLMSPDLGDGNDEKRLARRLQAIKRRSMKIEGLPSTENEADDNVVAHSSKTSPDCKTPVPPKRVSLGRRSLAPSNSGSSSFMDAWLAGKKKSDRAKEIAKTEVVPVVSELRVCAGSARSPRKRTADVKLSDSAVKIRATSKSFESPAKTRPSSRSFDSPKKPKASSISIDSSVKTKPCTRSFDSPKKPKASSISIDSPVKTKPSTRYLDSPKKPKASSTFVDAPVKTRPSFRSFDPPVKTKSTARSFDSPKKPKASSTAIDTPVKTKPSTRALDSPKKPKASSTSVDSPVKTKSTARSFDSPKRPKASSTSTDSPVKTKPSSQTVDADKKPKPSSKSSDSPAKTKSSSRSFDSPKKSKASSTSIDSPVKTKPSSTSLYSPKKPKASSTSFDSPVKTKSSSKLIDPSSSTSVTSPVRSKASSKSSSKLTPAKRGFDRSISTPVKSSSFLPPQTAASDCVGRPLRSSPKKSPSQSSPAAKVSSEERRTTQKTPANSAGKESLTSWLSTNKASPAKRSLDDAFKSEEPRNPPAMSASNVFNAVVALINIAEDSAGSAVSAKAEAYLKSPDFCEMPKKKARIDSVPQKIVTEEKVKNVSQKILKSSPKRTASSGAAKTSKVTFSGPSQSKGTKKKTPPRGKTALRNKPNDKSQTVMTSHFRPLVVSPNENKKVDVVTDIPVIEESGINVATGNAVLIRSTEEDRTMQTSPTQNCEDCQTVSPIQCQPVVNTNAVIEGERPPEGNTSCSSTLESENQSNVVPNFTLKACAPEESQTSPQESEDFLSAAMSEKQGTSTDLCEERPVVAADSCEEGAIVAENLCQEQPNPANVVEDPGRTEVQFGEQRTTAGMVEEQPTADLLEEVRTAADAVEEQPTADLSEEAGTTAGVVEDQPTADLSEEAGTTAGVVEDQPTTDLLKEATTPTDMVEEQTVDLLKEEMSTTDVEQPTTDLLEEVRAAADVVEEQPTVDLLKEEKSTADEQLTTNLLKEGSTPAGVVEEQPTADLLKEQSPADVSDEKPAISVDALEERRKGADVSDEQLTYVEVPEEQRITQDICDEPTTSADKLEDTRTLPDVFEEQQIMPNVLSDKSSGSVSRDEQDGSCDSLSSSQEPASSGNSNESCSKRTRKSVKHVNKPCHYRTRRSMRFLPSDVTD